MGPAPQPRSRYGDQASAVTVVAEPDEVGTGAPMKPFWTITQKDVDTALAATKWCPASRDYFRGGGYSSSESPDLIRVVT
jgi:hypothetical protein